MSRTAVLIQAHKNPDYILLLAQTYPDTRFYVHIDAKQDDVYNIIYNKKTDNINLIDDRVAVYWGGASQFKATLKLMNEAYKNKDNEIFHLMSGECLPLKSFSEIEELWNDELSYMESRKRKDVEWRMMVKVFYADSNFIRTTPGRILNRFFRMFSVFHNSTGIKRDDIYFGSQWFSINRKFLDEIIRTCDEDKYFHLFEKTSCSDEHVFQMLAKKLGVSLSSDNRRYIIFDRNMNSPKLLSSEDIESARESGYWFCRKVDNEILIEMIERMNER